MALGRYKYNFDFKLIVKPKGGIITGIGYGNTPK